jgi:uncharacterized protein (UPF0335 family)
VGGAAALRPGRSLATVEARNSLSRLIKEFRELKEGAASLTDHAVEIGPHRSGGAWLVPEVDARATIDRIARLEDRVEELEREIEDVYLARILEARAGEGDDFLTFEELVRNIDSAALADQRE